MARTVSKWFSTYSGFSLIELLSVLAIASILLFLALPSYDSYQEQNRLSEGKAQLLEIQVLLEQYRYRTQRYPEGLAELPSFDSDEPESRHAYYQFFLDSGQSACAPGQCYVLIAEPLLASRSRERLTLYSDGRRLGDW